MARKSMEELFLHELKDLYDAEHKITESLPTLAQAAGSQDLKAAFEEHLAQTKQQIKRLEQVFSNVGQKPQRENCAGMQGLVEEANKILEEGLRGAVKDAALIACAQKVEHYEIASYGTLRTFAYLLGNDEAAQLLQQTLDEEEQTDKKLTQLANKINIKAAG
jgi:ferritin-like metal-binding protein YciE